MIRKCLPLIASFFALLTFCTPLYAHETKPQEQEIKNSSKIEVQYKDGLYFETADKKFDLKINLQSQIRYQYMGVDGGIDTNSVSLRLARLLFQGHLFTQDLTYFMSVAWDNNGAGSLLDYYLQYRFSSALQLKAGQFKPPFSREFLTDQMKLSFADMTNQINQANGFNVNRDIGVTLFGSILSDRLDYALYGFNGNGRAVANSNKEMFVGSRLVLNILGKPGYQIHDFDRSETPQLAIGGAIVYDFGSDNAAIPQDKLIRSTGDIVFLYKGLALGTEGHFLKNTTSNASNFGFEGHGSYFILPKRLELAVRGAGTIRQDGGVYTEGSTNTYELGSALGYYFWRQNIKLVGDYNLLLNNGVVSGQKDHQFRLQVQLCFCQGGLS